MLKVAVVGGGSTYTPELVNGFLERSASLPISDLWLMDIHPERLEIVGGFARRMVKARGEPFRVHLTTDQHAAVAGASYVITQLRVGMMPARRADEYLGRRHGLVGQETTGIGGMAKALRTIPVILSIAEDMRELASEGVLINFTNPSGLATEALKRYAPQVASVGLCNAPLGFKMSAAERLEKLTGRKIDPASVEVNSLGLNHLSWHRGVTLDGEDVWCQLLADYLAELKQDAEPEWDPLMIEALQMIPNYYLQYYYDTAHKIAQQADWPPSRAEQVMEVEKDLLREYSDPALTAPPADLMKRGGAYYSTAATQLINAHYNNLGEVHVVNTRHAGAIPSWPEDWVLELPCRVDRAGIHPLPADPLPPVCFGLLAQIKAYELLTVEAAVHGDRHAAYQALLAHPLGPAASQVQAVLDDLLETHRIYLPQFFTC